MISGIRYRLGISKAGILAGCLSERNRYKYSTKRIGNLYFLFVHLGYFALSGNIALHLIRSYP